MTKAERTHLDRVVSLGCIVCKPLGHHSPAEVHHVRTGQGLSQRASNFRVLPLCPAHHRTGGYGVALHAGRKSWEQQHRSEEALLGEVRKGIDWEVAARSS